jgi:DNA-binding transcriptional MerR regulator
MDLPINDTYEKYFYKIGETAKKIGVEPYVVRYWEKEFSFLKPHKSKSSHRLYSKSDIEKLLLIKDCLYDKRFTIEGAKKAIRLKTAKCSEQSEKHLCEKKGVIQNCSGSDTGDMQEPDKAFLLKNLKDELNSIKNLLSSRKIGSRI